LPTQTATNTLVTITTPHFAHGYRLGRIWYFRGEAELPIDDAYLIGNIQNYCENGLHADPDWLSERIGFLMGMGKRHIHTGVGKFPGKLPRKLA